jgi:Coenzyme PQQ synthesis protein D (PqqD)
MVKPKEVKYRIPLEIAHRKLENELFFITPITSEIHSLDEMGIKMWDLILSGETSKNIGLIISEEFDTSPEIVVKDVENLIIKLQSKGLLEEY